MADDEDLKTKSAAFRAAIEMVYNFGRLDADERCRLLKERCLDRGDAPARCPGQYPLPKA